MAIINCLLIVIARLLLILLWLFLINMANWYLQAVHKITLDPVGGLRHLKIEVPFIATCAKQSLILLMQVTAVLEI